MNGSKEQLPVKAQVDVLVVGGGNAALCAAITAREQGANVLLLESSPEDKKAGYVLKMHLYNNSLREMLQDNLLPLLLPYSFSLSHQFP